MKKRAKVTYKSLPDYKEPLFLKRFINDRGKIIPAKRTGVSAAFQKKLSKEIKKARFMSLIPYTDRHSLL